MHAGNEIDQISLLKKILQESEVILDCVLNMNLMPAGTANVAGSLSGGRTDSPLFM